MAVVIIINRILPPERIAEEEDRLSKKNEEKH